METRFLLRQADWPGRRFSQMAASTKAAMVRWSDGMLAEATTLMK
jgi:hypothetical protein